MEYKVNSLRSGSNKNQLILGQAPSTVTGRTRFCYKLTDKGKKVLAKQVEEWDQFTGAISLILKEA
jgi:DNA-binding PadR family transcriptional regulator